jgi:DNA-binding XRE family transcriptional regulator/uncharacterized phage-associated protein
MLGLLSMYSRIETIQGVQILYGKRRRESAFSLFWLKYPPTPRFLIVCLSNLVLTVYHLFRLHVIKVYKKVLYFLHGFVTISLRNERNTMSNLSKNLEQARLARGYTQDQVATAIGVSRPTYVLIEKGQKDITLSQVEVLAAMFRVSLDELRGAPDGVSAITDSQSLVEKYKQMILSALRYGADTKDHKITKTKLAKLVYLADFTWYYNHLTPMSGMSYRRLPRGPVADIYFRAIDEMVEEGQLNLEESGRAFMISMTEGGEPPRNKLSDHELKMIEEIAIAWKDKQTEAVVDFTHEQLPWQICREGEVIPYGLITQEDPVKVYGDARVTEL